MSPERQNTNAHPIDHEPLQLPEVPAIHAHEETAALGGIRQAIANFRVERAERKLERLESDDRVIRHNPIEAQSLRGFANSPAKDPEDRPIGPRQKIDYELQGRRARQKRAAQRTRNRLDDVYGVPRPVTEDSPRAPRLNTGTAAAERWNKSVEKLEKLDRGQVASFDRTVRMSRKEAKLRGKSEKKYVAAGERMRRTDEQTQATVLGNTPAAARRSRRIQKQRAKVQRLRER